MDFVSHVDDILRAAQVKHYGITPLTRPLSMDIYKQWLRDGLHGSMSYLQDHVESKEDSRKFAPRARSAIVILKPYLPHPYPIEAAPKTLRTAMYACGGDYHLHFKNELERLADQLRKNFPDDEFLCFTDSAPILERDLAHRAGLGWVGKNTCLLNQETGSLFFIGEIFTSLEVSPTLKAPPDMCGTCDRCIRVCPTGALEGPRRLNATKCIAYWTIEAKDDAPPEIRSAISDWFFGCDLCQTVCPWNEKVFDKSQMQSSSGQNLHADSESLIHDLRWILTSSNKTLARSLANSPLLRARPHGLKRNALVVIGNLKIQALRAEVQRYLNEPRLKELAEWTAAQLHS